jgi:ligand-binding sensor domain-containing protein/serine phosphatase RsbU (regulator of sigma subunit)
MYIPDQEMKQNPVCFLQKLDSKLKLGVVVLLCFLQYSCHVKGNKNQVNESIPALLPLKHPIPSTLAVPVRPPVVSPFVKLSGKPQITVAGFYVSMQNYNTDQGLALSSVRSAFTDRKGNLWFGTLGGGVSRYDGKSFTNFTTREGLANNDVYSILEDKTGNMWFGTYGGGISRYDGKSFTTFNIKNGLANNTVFSMLQDKKGNLWFATLGGGVDRYDGKSFVNMTTKNGLVSDLILSIYEDKRGNLWFGSNSSGLSRYHPKMGADNKLVTASPADFTNYTTRDGLPNNSIYSILEDRAGNLWFGTDKGGVSLCHPGNRSDSLLFTNYTTEDGLANNSVMNMREDKNGLIWFATEGGISLYDPLNKLAIDDPLSGQIVFRNFSVAQGLSNSQVLCITEDKSGNLYFGTDGGGVCRYDGGAFVSFSTKEGLASNTVFGICEDSDDNYWFGMYEGGACKYDGKSFTNYTTKQGLPNNQVYSIFEDREKHIWLCTYGGGVSRFDGKSFTNYSVSEGLANNVVTCGLEDKKGNLWFGTFGGGVSCFDGKQFANYSTKQGLANNIVNSILEDKNGKLWFCTLGGGVSSFDPTAKQHSFMTYTTNDGLANNSVYCALEDKNGNLWFGTYGGGVSRFDGHSFSNYSATDGLTDDVVYDIVDDNKGMIWFGTNAGFSGLKGFRDVLTNKKEESKRNGYLVAASNKISSQQLGHYYRPIFENYNQKNGYAVKDINANAMYCDREGIIWAGTGDRLIRFDHQSIHRNKYAPQVIIQSVKIQNENISWYDLLPAEKSVTKIKGNSSPNIAEEVSLFGHVLTADRRDSMVSRFGDLHFDSLTSFYPIPENLIVPFNHNNITIDFTAIEPARPALVSYSYMLKGYDNGWSPPAQKNSADFGNIPEGEYTFLLKARSPDAIWTAPVSFSFKVLPPWYRTWWARLMEAFAILAVIAVVFRLRTMSLLQDREKLQRTIRERTGDIERQRKIIEEKNERITESISYAKHIQDSMLQSEAELRRHLPDFFICSLPKDIVSGDFYWFSERDNKIVIAVADCTGHGVPGAFMTVIGTMLLNEIVNDKAIQVPGLILGELHKGIDKLLKQHAASTQAQDGMDISVCVIDKEKHLLEFAGAKNSIYIIHEGELTAVKADPHGVGGSHSGEDYDNRVFATQTIQMKKGMQLYLYTDGYRDQFGGKTKEKFGNTRFRDLLMEISTLDSSGQKDRLHNRLKEWKSSYRQVDDILVVGIGLPF